MTVFIALGGADSVWRDLDQAKALLGDIRYVVGACNDAGVTYEGDLEIWATLHPEKLKKWVDLKNFYQPASVVTSFYTHRPHRTLDFPVTIRPEYRPGSSGMYLVDCSLAKGFERVVLCGMPMDPVPHYFDKKNWDYAKNYREAWVSAKTEYAGKVRSMSGWTRDLLGGPDSEWLRT